MYRKRDDSDNNDAEIAALLAKARSAFFVVREVSWLEWGAELMPDMHKAIAEDQRQAEIERRAQDHAEQLRLLNDRAEARKSRRGVLEKNMLEPGADLERLEGEFRVLDEAQKADEGTARELENERLELLRIVQGPTEVGDVNMEDETGGTQGKETEGESEREDDEVGDDGSTTSKRTTRQRVYVNVPPMKVPGKGGMGDRGLVSAFLEIGI
jgi:hypothetical protein